jgi:hypothetical protein
MLDENGAVMFSRNVKAPHVKILKHTLSGDAGIWNEMKTAIISQIRQAEQAALDEAAAQGDVLGFNPTNFADGNKYALIRAWFSRPEYRDKEARDNDIN